VANLNDVIDQLQERIESDHFIIIFGSRNAASGPGLGFRGVRDRRLLLIYIDALERLYSVLVQFAKRRPPVVGHTGKTVIYVFDSSDVPPFFGSPFTDVDPDGIPYIGLQARNNDPTIEAAFQRARADATHEGAHLFNFRERHPHDPYTSSWVWFDEGTAVFFERYVFAGNPDTLRYAMNWVDIPDASLDDWNFRYESGLFVRYLYYRYGIEFLSEVWMNSAKRETPWDTLQRLLAQGPQGTVELFREYCIESFFIWDHRGVMFMPEIYSRYGHRRIVERFEVKVGAVESRRGLALPHLACHYHQINFSENVATVAVTVSSAWSEMMLDVIAVTPDGARGERTPLREGTPHSLRTLGSKHFVLVVCNCSIVRGTHDYQIALSAS
jgi:hypothetical protein